MKTWLIQRAKFEDRKSTGIDSILSFDYMGSAEFEWGALPKSLKFIRGHFKEYDYHNVMVGDKMEFEKFIELAPIEIQEVLEKCKICPQTSLYHPEAPHDDVPHNVYKHIKIVYYY